MNDRRTMPTGSAPSSARLLLASTLLLGGASCSHGGGADHAGHDHAQEQETGEEAGHDDHAPKTDPHHVAEGRTDCEDDVTLPEGALERYGIEVAPVAVRDLVSTVSAPGHLAFPQGSLARVGSMVEGRIAEIRVRSGDAVTKGDPVLVVESPGLGEAQSDYLQKRTIAATAGPTLELAREAQARAKELYDRVQGIALADVQRLESELRQAERDREVARAAEAAAFNRLLLLGMGEDAIRQLEETGKVDPRFLVAAPVSGRVVEMGATVGELVGPEKDRLLVIGDVSTLWAIAEVSESRLSEIAIGARARVRVPALRHAPHAGQVAAAPVVLEPLTRTAEVRIELPNPDGALLPGMFIQVEIDSSLGAGEPMLAVPDGAVMTVEGKPSVFVPLEPGGTVFCVHEVRVGAPVGDDRPVLSGLDAGDLVVVAGTFHLKAELGKASAEHQH